MDETMSGNGSWGATDITVDSSSEGSGKLAAEAVLGDAAEPAAEPAPDESADAPAFTYEGVRAAVTANRANTLALLGCLRAVSEPRPFREAEAAVGESRAMALTMQTPHALYGILLKCGAVEAITVPEGEAPEAGAPESLAEPGADTAEAAGADIAKAAAPASLPDQPVDYLLHITDLGRMALAEFEPTKRFEELLAGEPAGYADAYGCVLACCETGASKAVIERALAGHEALSHPKHIYPGYFISKLETVDGISWDGVWRTTEAGRRMAALLA